MNECWHFINNQYGADTGLKDSNMLMFAKDPFESLAREVCQNSIDARAKDSDKPSIVHFKTFKLKTQEVPGIDLLKYNIQNCLDYCRSLNNESEAADLQTMLNLLNRDYLECLRVSDFNTTGLIGVDTNKTDSPFFLLTKGSGSTNKHDGQAGSKGIGKYAAFAVSNLNTVFYSTKTFDFKEGGMGISKLRSAPIKKDDPYLLTTGIGYYALDKNMPIQHPLLLDKNYKRDTTGTDVFILGVELDELTIEKIVYTVLDSFMYAILNNNVEVKVESYNINKDTLEEYLNIEFLDKVGIGEKAKKALLAQYELLSSDEIPFETIKLPDDYGEIKIKVKLYDPQTNEIVSNQCDIIRHPYMKIKKYAPEIPCLYSAVCVIEDPSVNKMLRTIENPQHTEWEVEQLITDKETKKRYKGLVRSINRVIKDYISNIAMANIEDTTDLPLASYYIPDIQELGSESGKQLLREKASISFAQRRSYDKPKKTTQKEKKGKNNSKPNGNRRIDNIRFASMYHDFTKEYTLFFKAPCNANNCELKLFACGMGSDRPQLNILSASLNNNPCNIRNNQVIYGFDLEENQEYILEYKIANDEKLAVEVELDEIR